jgi:hypothetical protein
MTDPDAEHLATNRLDPRQVVAGEGQVRPGAHLAPGRRREAQGHRHRRDAARGLSRQDQVEPREPVRRNGRERAHAVVVACGLSAGHGGNANGLLFIALADQRFTLRFKISPASIQFLAASHQLEPHRPPPTRPPLGRPAMPMTKPWPEILAHYVGHKDDWQSIRAPAMFAQRIRRWFPRDVLESLDSNTTR